MCAFQVCFIPTVVDDICTNMAAPLIIDKSGASREAPVKHSHFVLCLPSIYLAILLFQYFG